MVSSEVTTTINKFNQDLSRILKSNFIDLLIWGSVALDDFTPNKGDIDFLVITALDLTDTEIYELEKLHDSYRNSNDSNLMYQLEGLYYLIHVLTDLKASIKGYYVGSKRKGWKVIDKFSSNMFDLLQWSTISLKANNSSLTFYEPTQNDIMQNIKDDYANWNKYIDYENVPAYVIVQWASRVIYFIDFKEVGSKTKACNYFYNNYLQEDYVKRCSQIRSPIIEELSKSQHENDKTIAKKCLQIFAKHLLLV